MKRPVTALLACVVVVFAAPAARPGAWAAGGDRALAAPAGPATIDVGIKAFRVADDDGTRASTITSGDILAQVQHVNDVWGPAGIAFHFTPRVDLVDINNTLINEDCSVDPDAPPPPAGDPPCHYAPNNRAKDELAVHNDGKLVVLFRWQGDDPVYDQGAGQWKVGGGGPGSGGSSSRCGHWVNMPPTQSSWDDLLAHEIGHYLHNTHTFSGKPGTIQEAASKIRQWIEDPSPDRPKSEGLNVFDGDLRIDGVTDTPPDPANGLWLNAFGAKCDSADDQLDITVTFTDKSTKTYTLEPDRGNIMSYFACDPTAHSSPQQRTRIRDAIEDSNRRHLIGLTGGALVTQPYSSTWSTGYTSLVSFELETEPYYLIYKAGNGFVRIGSVATGEPENLWSNTWSTGYTNFLPYALGGKQYVLAYKSGSGFVRIIRANAGGQGVTNIWSADWSSGYTGFTTYTSGGQVYWLFYKAGNAFVRMGRFNAGGQGVTNLWSNTWSTTGYDTLISFVLNDKPYYFLHKNSTGFTRIGRFRDTGQGVTNLWQGSWSTGYTSITLFYRGDQPYLFLYKKATGFAKIVRIRPDAQGVTQVWSGSFASGATSVMPFEVSISDFSLLYDQASGAAAIASLCA